MNSKPLLVLDLDETLVHASETYDPYGEIYFPSVNELYYVRHRPYLKEFLKTVYELYVVAIWSYGHKDYVSWVLKKFDIKADFVLTRERCVRKPASSILIAGEFYQLPEQTIKPLKKIWRRYKKYNKHNTVVVDDTPCTFSRNYGNAISIKEFIPGKEDTELLILKEKLIKLANSNNFRKDLREIQGHPIYGKIDPLDSFV